MMTTLVDQLDRIPPCECRLCGRVRGGWAKSLAQISEESGIPIGRVKFISRQPTWKHLTVDETERFSQACDVDLLRPRKKLFYLRRAFSSGGLHALEGGLGIEYVKRQFEIRRRYDEESTVVVSRVSTRAKGRKTRA